MFHSRVDGSATMWKEQSLWSCCGLMPWKNDSDATWYKTSRVAPAEALKAADQAGAYLLTDRSTLLAQTSLRTIFHTTVFFEPTSTDDSLMNSRYALYSPFIDDVRSKSIQHFIQYMLSPQGQNLIGSYGRSNCGLPLFANLEEGFARTKLVGGIPRNGK